MLTKKLRTPHSFVVIGSSCLYVLQVCADCVECHQIRIVGHLCGKSMSNNTPTDWQQAVRGRSIQNWYVARYGGTRVFKK